MSFIIYITFSAFNRVTPVPYDYGKPIIQESKRWACSRSLYFLEWLIYVNYPPFTHMEIAYFENPTDRYLTSYTLSVSRGAYEYKTRYESSRWGFIALNVTKEQREKIISLCKEAVSDSMKFSLNKILHIEASIRRFLFLSRMSYPSLKKDKFMCSEFIITILQQAGIIKFDIHPSYAPPSEFFSYLVYHCSEIINIPKSVSPFTNKQNALVLFKESTGKKVPYITPTSSSIMLDNKSVSLLTETTTTTKTIMSSHKKKKKTPITKKKKEKEISSFTYPSDTNRSIFLQ